ncbi:MAG TPA: hypothetical protein PKV72_03740 [Candidatus Peribacteria bacterium]|nr:hypothetical protein [Candidatus Peribacteria bacterium]
MPPRTSPDAFRGNTGETPRNPEQREKAKKEVKQQLRTLMTAVNARDREQARPERDEKRLKEMNEQINKLESQTLATLALLLNPDGTLPDELQKEFTAEFSDPASREFVNNLLNGEATRLGTDAENLGREIDGRPVTSNAGHVMGRIESRVSDIVDGFIQNSGLLGQLSDRFGIPEQALAKQLQQVRPFVMNALRGIFANIADNFKMVPGAQEFAIRARLESTWQPLLKLKMQNPNTPVARAIRAFPGGPDALKEAYVNALIGQATERSLAAQAGQPTPTTQVTLESVLGLASPAPGSPAPAPSATEQTAKKEAAGANRPLGANAETIQEMAMTFSNGEFRVQKGSDTFKALPKHGTEAAVVTEVTPVRPATGQVENLTIKTRKGTEDLTKTVRAADIKTALEPSGNKRVVVDNVTYEFTRV